MTESNMEFAGLLVRVFTGVLFFFQGYDKLFRIGIKGVTDAFRSEAAKAHVPTVFLVALACYTSVAEFFGGLMLVAGFMTNYAAYILGIDLVLVCIAFSYMEPMWNMRHVFPRLVLLTVLLLLPPESQNISLDNLLGRNAAGPV